MSSLREGWARLWAESELCGLLLIGGEVGQVVIPIRVRVRGPGEGEREHEGGGEGEGEGEGPHLSEPWSSVDFGKRAESGRPELRPGPRYGASPAADFSLYLNVGEMGRVGMVGKVRAVG